MAAGPGVQNEGEVDALLWSAGSRPGPGRAGTPTPASCAPPAACGTLTANEYLGSNGALTSCDGRFNLVMQSDGNLVLYEGSTALWASNTVNSSATKAILQGDGNFVLYTSAGAAVWASGTSGNSGASLTVGDDGNVVITSSAGATVWSTNTGGH